jgi:hypothetical protein
MALVFFAIGFFPSLGLFTLRLFTKATRPHDSCPEAKGPCSNHHPVDDTAIVGLRDHLLGSSHPAVARGSPAALPPYILGFYLPPFVCLSRGKGMRHRGGGIRLLHHSGLRWDDGTCMRPMMTTTPPSVGYATDRAPADNRKVEMPGSGRAEAAGEEKFH